MDSAVILFKAILVNCQTVEFRSKYNFYLFQYTCEESLIADFRLMFANCKHYNEEGSQIYQDAETLENVLNTKIQELGGSVNETPKIKIPGKPGRYSFSIFSEYYEYFFYLVLFNKLVSLISLF